VRTNGQNSNRGIETLDFIPFHLKAYAAQTARIPTGELKHVNSSIHEGAAVAQTARIPTGELKRFWGTDALQFLAGTNGQNSNRGIETVGYALLSARMPAHKRPEFQPGN